MKEKMSGADGHVPVEVRCVSVPRGTGGWGRKSPFEEGDYRVFRQYIDEIEKIDQKKWDFVLIDGRARVAAAFKALSFLRDDSVVVLHDSWRLMHRYRDIFTYYDKVAESWTVWNQGIAVLRRKRKFKNLEGRKDLVQEILDKMYGTKTKK